MAYTDQTSQRESRICGAFTFVVSVALRKAATERAEAYRLHIEWALSQPGLDGKLITFGGAGGKLNEPQIPSPMGGRWSSMNVADIAVRLKLREKPIRVPRKVLQERVEALWRSRPDCTGHQVVDMLKPKLNWHMPGVGTLTKLSGSSRETESRPATDGVATGSAHRCSNPHRYDLGASS